MPLYEYKCTSCGQEFEELVSITATTSPACPACNAAGTEKKISRTSNLGTSAGAGSCGPSGFT